MIEMKMGQTDTNYKQLSIVTLFDTLVKQLMLS